VIVRRGCSALALVAVLALVAPGASLAAKKPAKPKPKPTADLSIVATPTVSGSKLNGERVTISAIVRAGKVAVKSTKTAFFLSTNAVRDKKDKRVAVTTTAGLKAKGTKVIPASFTIPATLKGSFYVIACADGTNKLAELSEKNNCHASVKQVVKPPYSTLSIAATHAAAEGNSGTANAVTFDVVLSAPYTYPVTFRWSGGGADGTATATDAATVRGTVTIPPGATSTTLSVPITGDTRSEADETVGVQITALVNAKFASGTSLAAIGVIMDDDLDDVRIPSGSITNTSVVLKFDYAPTNITADGSQFVIAENDDDVEVTGATISGNVVTLTTTEQDTNKYTLSFIGLQAGLRTFPTTMTFRGV
jgi:hypothetical protein